MAGYEMNDVNWDRLNAQLTGLGQQKDYWMKKLSGEKRNLTQVTRDYSRNYANILKKYGFANKGEMDYARQLYLYDRESGKHKEAIRKSFRIGSEITAARQQRGVQQQVNEYLAARGISGNVGAGISAKAYANLAAKVTDANLDLDTKLNMLEAQARDTIAASGIDYLRNLALMETKHGYDMALAQLNARIQQDIATQQSYNAMMGQAGQLMGLLGIMAL